MTNNRERFPEIIQEPKEVEVGGYKYTVYRFVFKSLSDLYNYLKGNPEINTEAYGDVDQIASVKNDYSFAGIPYDEAVEQLINYYDPKYKEFLALITKTKFKNTRKGASFKAANSVSGGIIRPQAIALGDPHIYRTTRIVKSDAIVNIYIEMSYPSGTNKSQVYHNAVILTNIIHALEKQGYQIDINAFSLGEMRNELFDMILNIKHNNSGVNYQALYRTMCNVEFLRRIIFRVMETSDVKTWWRKKYGYNVSERFARNYYKMKPTDLYFDAPGELGVYGYDIGDDFERVIDHFQLNNIIDVKEAKVLLKNSINN